MGDTKPQEFNTDTSRMSKRQKRVLGSWKGIYAYRGDIWQEEDSNGNIEILLFLRSQKRRISRGYCRDGRPRRVYWAIGPVRGHSILRGRVDASVGAQASEWVKGVGFKVPRSMSKDRFHLGLTR